MEKTSNASLERMGKLNNALVKAVEVSSCSPVETIQVLLMFAHRIEDAFKISIMGNPVSSIKKRLENGSNMG